MLVWCAESFQYAQKRKVFGKLLIESGVIRWKVLTFVFTHAQVSVITYVPTICYLFDKPFLCVFNAFFKLAEMARQIEALQDMVERCTYSFSQGKPDYEV